MLRPYPATALAENWVHQTLTDVVRLIHTSGGVNGPESGWLSGANPRRPDLEKNQHLKAKVAEYATVVAGLSAPELAIVVQSFEAQNQVEGLLNGSHDLPAALPESVEEAAKTLFLYGFSLLTDTKTRDEAFRVISEKSDRCPFCVDEYFDQPGARRTDLDHYLVRGTYPFAAANLQNLVFMGPKCNNQKSTTDILRHGGDRRTAFYPYGCAETHIKLSGTAALEWGVPVFEWTVSFDPESPEAETWDQVFAVRERLCRDVLHTRAILRWVERFGEWCRRRTPPIEIAQLHELHDAMATFAHEMNDDSAGGRDLLMAPVFKLMHEWCGENAEMLSFIAAILNPGPANPEP